MGKTAFVLNIAQHVVFKKDFCTAIFSLEMSKEQLMNRLFAMESRVDAQTLRNGNLTDSDWEKLVESVGMIGNSKLIIDDTPGISISELRSKMCIRDRCWSCTAVYTAIPAAGAENFMMPPL